MTISPSKLGNSLTQFQQLFTKSDTNKNGSLNKTEFAAAASGIAGLSGSSDADKANLFARMDLNNDGELSKDELKDGIKLAEQVQKALLMAQELMSGSTLMNMIGGDTTHSDDATNAASMFSTGKASQSSSVPGSMNLADILGGQNADSETTSTDPYTSQLQALIAKYNAAATTTVDAKNNALAGAGISTTA